MTPLLNRKEVAATLGVSTKQIYRYELRGMLPSIQLSKRLIPCRQEDVVTLLERRTQKQAFANDSIYDKVIGRIAQYFSASASVTKPS